MPPLAMSLEASEIVSILLVIAPLVVGWALRTKAKALKLDILETVDKRIKEEIQPLENKIESFEKKLNEIFTDHKVMLQRQEDCFKILSKLDERLEKNDNYYRDRLQHLYDNKQDRK
jgi:peptidoglycan hydrolase CwlO-like protein